MTVSARGKVVKTWINGVPAAHWVEDGTYPKGFFGLQIHKGTKGKVLFNPPPGQRIEEVGSCVELGR